LPIWTFETQVMIKRKGRESYWQFYSRPLKVENWLDSFTCRQRATYHWKTLDEGYNFALDLIAIEGFHTKLCAPKVARVPIVKISRLPFRSLGTKNHLDVAPMKRHRVYYKGEDGGFPQVWTVMSFVSSNYWFVLAPKMFQPCTNYFVSVLCKFMWVIEACQFFLIPSRSSSMPLYPSKVLWAKECAPIPCSSVVFNLDSHLNP
jgi:hypothetical protein